MKARTAIFCGNCGQGWYSDIGDFATTCPACDKSVCGGCERRECGETKCSAILHESCAKRFDGEVFCPTCWSKRVAEAFAGCSLGDLVEASLLIAERQRAAVRRA